MRRHVVRTLLATAAAVFAVALTAGQAFAAPTITITGANIGLAGSGPLTLTEVTSGLSISCTVGIRISLRDVTHAPLPYTTVQSGGAAHSIVAWSFSACTSPATLTVPAADLPDDMVFNATATTPPQATGQLQTAGAGGALFHVTFMTCGFNATGGAVITWTNGTGGQLKFVGTGTLHSTAVAAGCLGLVNTGDVLRLTGTLNIPASTVMMGP